MLLFCQLVQKNIKSRRRAVHSARRVAIASVEKLCRPPGTVGHTRYHWGELHTNEVPWQIPKELALLGPPESATQVLVFFAAATGHTELRVAQATSRADTVVIRTNANHSGRPNGGESCFFRPPGRIEFLTDNIKRLQGTQECSQTPP